MSTSERDEAFEERVIGIKTLMLQFHNVGWCSVVAVFALALIFTGLAQLAAGNELMACALYMMASVIYIQVFGRIVLAVGKAWLEKKSIDMTGCSRCDKFHKR